ncbi:histidine phosphatase family protein [Alkalicoccus halolimnae]|uniref:Histidine phosphatase family protein n=1 Tax=Alkalicoccus halolimnae TaxID=1667239 RepID=A0A5C7FA68_9BACI|nr:histidine phosphatase family protein [Alkalicoccus halolimnae]TXF82784.1 histidine phosphatase family protein [Alkalicoccus halolimnae]
MDTVHSLDLYLVRHGITKANQEKRYVGWTDVSLAEEAPAQLEDLRRLTEDSDWEHIAASDLKRCRETADIIVPDRSYKTEARLREMDFGSWEMKTYNQLQNDPRYRKWIGNVEKESPENGETIQAFRERVDGWLTDFLSTYPKGRVLVITHGGVIRQLLLSMRAVETFWERAIPHGKAMLLRLEFREESWTCMSLSVVPSPEKETM